MKGWTFLELAQKGLSRNSALLRNNVTLGVDFGF